MLRVVPRNVGHASVGLREQAQLFQPLVPRGIAVHLGRSALPPAWVGENTDFGERSLAGLHDRGNLDFRGWNEHGDTWK